MAKVIIHATVTLDGFMADTNGGMDWTADVKAVKPARSNCPISILVDTLRFLRENIIMAVPMLVIVPMVPICWIEM